MDCSTNLDVAFNRKYIPRFQAHPFKTQTEQDMAADLTSYMHLPEAKSLIYLSYQQLIYNFYVKFSISIAQPY